MLPPHACREGISKARGCLPLFERPDLPPAPRISGGGAGQLWASKATPCFALPHISAGRLKTKRPRGAPNQTNPLPFEVSMQKANAMSRRQAFSVAPAEEEIAMCGSLASVPQSPTLFERALLRVISPGKQAFPADPPQRRRWRCRGKRYTPA